MKTGHSTAVQENEVSKPVFYTLFALFFLSGFCALALEVVWIRRFSLILGSSHYASAVVLAVFMGGNALGFFLFGRASTRTRRPVVLFALLQFGLGIYALLFPLICSAVDPLYQAVYGFASGSFAFLLVVRAFVSAACVLLPAMAIGGGLPLLTRALAKRNANIAKNVTSLYALDALGAAAGSLATGMVLLRFAGAWRTNLFAAMISIGVGAIGLVMFRECATGGEIANTKKRKHPPKGVPAVPRKLIYAAFALSGLLLMAHEVFWLRYLAFLLRDTVHLYSGIIAIIIGALATGALCGRALLSRTQRPFLAWGIIEIAIILLSLFAVESSLRIPRILRMMGGGLTALKLTVILLVMLFPPFGVAGMRVPFVAGLLCQRAEIAGERVGTAVGLNTLGAIAGSLLCGFLMFPLLGIQTTLYILWCGGLVLGATLLVFEKGHMPRTVSLVAVLTAAAIPVLYETSAYRRLPKYIFKKISGPQHRIGSVREGAVNVAWTRTDRAGRKEMFDGVRIVGWVDNQSSPFVLQGAIAMALCAEKPRTVLSLACGAGLSAYAAEADSTVKRIDCVDISKVNIETGRAFFAESRSVWADRRVRSIIDDAYGYVKNTRVMYDLILIEPTPPMMSFRSATLYTKEFYSLVRGRLAAGGWFMQVLPLRHVSEREMRNILHTFASVFGGCMLWWNNHECLLFGTHEPVQLKLSQIAARLRSPAVGGILRRYSGPARLHIVDNFLAALLLTDTDLRRVADGGLSYTDDGTRLMYSKGPRPGEVPGRVIYAALSQWPELCETVEGLEEFESHSKTIEKKREALMAMIVPGRRAPDYGLLKIGEIHIKMGR